MLHGLYKKLSRSTSFIFRSFDQIFSFEAFNFNIKKDFSRWYTKMNSMTPMQVKKLDPEDMENIFDKNYLFYKVISLIKGRTTIDEILTQIKNDPTLAFDENSLQSTEQAFMDLIQFLHDRDFIMLLDEFHINNHYKVTLKCIKKDKDELKEEYIKFIKSVDLGEEDNKRFSQLEGITNPDAEII